MIIKALLQPNSYIHLDVKKEQEIQCHGFFSILSSLKKSLTRISISLIHPLPFIYLAAYISSGILHKPNILEHTTRTGTKSYDKVSHIVASDWTHFFLSKLCHFIIFLMVCVFSTSSIVYTIACIYTTRGLNFKNVVSVVSNVWKRLIITFLGRL
ncbi:hypothetical protein LIER_42763 [Lithospermum erythrorhizon]|uniref:Uncharacterized protein n=1 Tax=Lithospermum erythrorhizon TaxID=34254 RepID=A0AAV3NXK4_LITER